MGIEGKTIDQDRRLAGWHSMSIDDGTVADVAKA